MKFKKGMITQETIMKSAIAIALFILLVYSVRYLVNYFVQGGAS